MPPNSLLLLDEHAALTDSLMNLAGADDRADALYITGIMMTDLAEIGRAPPQLRWPCPGDVPLDGWPIYRAVLQWCQTGMRFY